MPSETILEALKPFLGLLFLSGLYTMPAMDISWRRFLIKSFLNLALVSMSVAMTGYTLYVVVVHSISDISQGGYFTFHLYMLTSRTGQLFCALAYPLCASTSLRIFLAELNTFLEKYHINFVGTKIRYLVLVFSLSVFSFSVSVASAAAFRAGGEILLETNFLQEAPMIMAYGALYFTFMQAICFFTIYIVVWGFLQAQANYLSREVRSLCRNASLHPLTSLVDDLERCRTMHVELCALVRKGSKVVCPYLVNTYGAGIPTLLFIIHSLIYKYFSSSDVTIRLLFVSLILLFAAGVTITSVVLNKKVRWSSI